MIKKRTKYTDNTATDYYYKITSYVNNHVMLTGSPGISHVVNYSGWAATYVGQRQILTLYGSGLALPTIKLINSLTY